MDFDQAINAYLSKREKERQKLMEAMARDFHEAYERLAPEFGYVTREDTREFDPKSANGRLMVAVIKDLFW